MEATAFFEPHSQTHHQLHSFIIIPTVDRLRTSKRLEKHAEEMKETIEKLFQARNISYDPSIAFIKELDQKLPLVHVELPDETPGEITITLFSRYQKRADLQPFFVEMCERYLLPYLEIEIVSVKQLAFHFSDFPKKTFFVSELIVHINDEAALNAIQEKIPTVSQEVALGA